jgi:hypothetical protein
VQRTEEESGRRARWRGLPLAWLLPAVVWLLVVAWRPSVLGFYHDDWATLRPLSADLFATFMIEQASRPVYGMLMSAARLALPADPLAYQTLLAVLICASALSIGLLGRRIAALAGAAPSAARWAGAAAAATWIAIPWCLGVSVWPTTFPAQVSVVAFCAMTLAVLRDVPLRSKLLTALPIFLFASLISELFWLSFLPVLLILLATGRRWVDRERIRELVILGIGFVAVQGLLVLQNRLWVMLGVGINRSLNAAWLDTAWLSLSLIPSEFSKAVLYPEAAAALLTGMLCVALVGAALARRMRFVIVTLVAMAAGMLVSLLLFALAGYRAESIGVFSRTTVVMSVWLSLLPALAVAGAAGRPAALQVASALLVLALLVILAVSTVRNTDAWITSWRFEQELLDSLPVDRLRQARPGSMLVIDAHKPDGAVEGLEGFWDASGAVYLRKPELRSVFMPLKYRDAVAIADVSKKLTTWDGKAVMQAWCHSPGSPLWSLPASAEVYVWSYPARQLVRLDAPATLGCKAASQ